MGFTPMHPDDLFNGYVGAHVAYVLQQIGLFSIIAPGERMRPEDIATRTGSDSNRLQALLKAGHALGYITYHPDMTISISAVGEALREQLGYFVWLVGGYGDFFHNLEHLTRKAGTWKHLRNEGMVAQGTDMNQRSLMQTILLRVMDTLSVTKIADLGCGNGGRLVTFCQRYPQIKGIGIDISADAIKLANENVRKNGLEDRLEMQCVNVLETIQADTHKDRLADVDLVCSFMVLHDLYNIPDLWPELFQRLRAAFPKARFYLFADTVSMPPVEELDTLPIFSIGYELLHTYMGLRLPTKADYDNAFTKADLTVETCVDFGAPYTYLYLLRV